MHFADTPKKGLILTPFRGQQKDKTPFERMLTFEPVDFVVVAAA